MKESVGKRAVVSLAAFCILAQSAIASAEEAEVFSFHATVQEVYASSVLAVPYIDSEEYDNSDLIYVGLDGIDEELLVHFLDAVEVNDSIVVEYNGVFLETYPVQIAALSVTIEELSETAEAVKAQITGEGFLVEFKESDGGNYYQADTSEILRILPSPQEDDPEGELPDEAETETYSTESGEEAEIRQKSTEELEYLSTLGMVTVYHYADSETARQMSECFDRDDPSEFAIQNGDMVNAMVIDYIAPICLYLREDCIVMYCGTNETVRAVLDEAFGEPFAADSF